MFVQNVASFAVYASLAWAVLLNGGRPVASAYVSVDGINIYILASQEWQK